MNSDIIFEIQSYLNDSFDNLKYDVKLDVNILKKSMNSYLYKLSDFMKESITNDNFSNKFNFQIILYNAIKDLINNSCKFLKEFKYQDIKSSYANELNSFNDLGNKNYIYESKTDFIESFWKIFYFSFKIIYQEIITISKLNSKLNHFNLLVYDFKKERKVDDINGNVNLNTYISFLENKNFELNIELKKHHHDGRIKRVMFINHEYFSFLGSKFNNKVLYDKLSDEYTCSILDFSEDIVKTRNTIARYTKLKSTENINSEIIKSKKSKDDNRNINEEICDIDLEESKLKDQLIDELSIELEKLEKLNKEIQEKAVKLLYEKEQRILELESKLNLKKINHQDNDSLLNDDILQLYKTNENLLNQIGVLENQIKENNSLIENYENEINRNSIKYNEVVFNLENQIKNLILQNEELASDSQKVESNLKNELFILKASLDEEIKKKNELEEKIASSQSNFEKFKIEIKDKYENEILKLLNESNSYKNEKNHLSSKVEDFEVKINRITNKNDFLEKSNKLLENNIKLLKDELDLKTKLLVKSQNKINKFKETVKENNIIIKNQDGSNAYLSDNIEDNLLSLECDFTNDLNIDQNFLSENKMSLSSKNFEIENMQLKRKIELMVTKYKDYHRIKQENSNFEKKLKEKESEIRYLNETFEVQKSDLYNKLMVNTKLLKKMECESKLNHYEERENSKNDVKRFNNKIENENNKNNEYNTYVRKIKELFIKNKAKDEENYILSQCIDIFQDKFDFLNLIIFEIIKESKIMDNIESV